MVCRLSSLSVSRSLGIGFLSDERAMSRRKQFFLSGKLKLCRSIENGKVRKEVCQQFKVYEPALSEILKEKDTIESECIVGHGKVTQPRTAQFPELGRCLVEWIMQIAKCSDKWCSHKAKQWQFTQNIFW